MKPSRLLDVGFDFSQETFRSDDLEKAKPLLKLTSLFCIPLHQIEQIVVTGHQVVGFRCNRQIDVRLVFRITPIDKALWNLPDKRGVLRQSLKESFYCNVSEVAEPDAHDGPTEHITRFGQ